MNKCTRMFSIFTAILIALGNLTACSGSNVTSAENKTAMMNKDRGTITSTERGETKKEDLITLNVAYMPNYSSLAEVVAGIETGAFEKQGLRIKLLEFADGPTIISAMENGSINIGYIGNGAHKLAIKGKTKIFCFAHLGNGDKVMALKSRGITSPADLRGKTVGYAAGTSSEAILRLTLQLGNLTLKDIRPMEMEASSMVSAMMSGSLDACAVWSPTTLTIEEQLKDNVITLSSNKTFADQTASVDSWIVMDSYAKKMRIF